VGRWPVGTSPAGCWREGCAGGALAGGDFAGGLLAGGLLAGGLLGGLLRVLQVGVVMVSGVQGDGAVAGQDPTWGRPGCRAGWGVFRGSCWWADGWGWGQLGQGAARSRWKAVARLRPTASLVAELGQQPGR